MHWIPVVRIAAIVALLLGGAMAVPLAVSLVLGGPDAAALALAMVAAAGPAAVVLVLTPRAAADVGRREALVAVTSAWIAAAFLGALPYRFLAVFGDAPAFGTMTAAVFESMSGFTTTGATVVADVESLPRGILLWRALTQWLGGMGIITLFVAVLPMLGIGAQELFRAEAPGPTKGKITPQWRDTARLLWTSYVALSAAEAVALRIAGMAWFDAVCHTFTTMATGGFSTRNGGIAEFDSPAIEVIITAFMVAAGINFGLHVRLLRGGGPREYLRDAEARAYAAILAAATVVVAAALWAGGESDGPIGALRRASFQVVSIMTTTGYHSADFDAWFASAPAAPVLLLILMFVGGCSGSTAGSMKVSRIVIAARHGWRELARMAHPRAVFPVRMGRETVAEGDVSMVMAFVGLFLFHFAAGTVLVAATGEDLVTSASAVAATLANVGPGLGDIGPARHYADLHPAAHWVLMAAMLLGRLELMTVLALLTRPFWRR